MKDRYLHAINGHRDVGQTACPGRYLYAKIPYIRTLAQRIQNAAQSGVADADPPTPTPTPTVPATPLDVFRTPTQTPQHVDQAGGRDRPSRRPPNLAGSSYPDLALKRSDGRVVVLPTGGQTGFGAPVTTPGSLVARWTWSPRSAT